MTMCIKQWVRRVEGKSEPRTPTLSAIMQHATGCNKHEGPTSASSSNVLSSSSTWRLATARLARKASLLNQTGGCSRSRACGSAHRAIRFNAVHMQVEIARRMPMAVKLDPALGSCDKLLAVKPRRATRHIMQSAPLRLLSCPSWLVASRYVKAARPTPSHRQRNASSPGDAPHQWRRERALSCPGTEGACRAHCPGHPGSPGSPQSSAAPVSAVQPAAQHIIA